MNDAIQQQLDEAKKAYHELLTGQAVVKIKRGDREMQYTPANKEALKKHIEELESNISGQPARRSFRFNF